MEGLFETLAKATEPETDKTGRMNRICETCKHDDTCGIMNAEWCAEKSLWERKE